KPLYAFAGGSRELERPGTNSPIARSFRSVAETWRTVQGQDLTTMTWQERCRNWHHAFTVISTVSIAACPDFWNGRGMGCAWPLPSIVRQRKVYSPAESPGNSAAQ